MSIIILNDFNYFQFLQMGMYRTLFKKHLKENYVRITARTDSKTVRQCNMVLRTKVTNKSQFDTTDPKV